MMVVLSVIGRILLVILKVVLKICCIPLLVIFMAIRLFGVAAGSILSVIAGMWNLFMVILFFFEWQIEYDPEMLKDIMFFFIGEGAVVVVGVGIYLLFEKLESLVYEILAW